MKRLLIVAMTAVFVAAAVGCAKKPAPPPPTPEAAVTDVRGYFPAEPKLTWVYEGSGNEYAGFTARAMLREGDRVQFSHNSGGTRLGQVYQVSAAEVTLLFSREEFYSDASLLAEKPNRHRVILKAPLKAGASWESAQERREVVGVSEAVQVPAGTYHNVVKIKVTSLAAQASGQTFEYYAPDIGLVLREFIAGQDRIVSRLKAHKQTPASEVKEGTLTIEGTPHKVVLSLVEGDPLPFYTYAPPDLAVSRATSPEGTEFRFSARFGGQQRDDVYLAIFFYPPGMTTDQAVLRAANGISKPGWIVKGSEKRYTWSVREWTLRDTVRTPARVGHLAVGQHKDMLFHVMSYMPPEFGDGFGPRSRLILEQFMWTDTNEKLQK